MGCPDAYTTTKWANLRQLMTTAKKKTHSFVAMWCWKKFKIQASVSPFSKKIHLKGSKKHNGLKWISQCSSLELVTLFPLYNVAAVCCIISIVMFSLLTGANTLLIIILFEWSHSRKDDIGSCISLCHYACKDHLSLPRHTTSAIWGENNQFIFYGGCFYLCTNCSTFYTVPPTQDCY